MIRREGRNVAVVLFSGIQYFTGQWFPMKAITEAGQAEVNLLLDRFPRSLTHVVTREPL